MLTIEQLKALPDIRAKFQAVTGLTWDPTEITDEHFLETIQWLFPKGAGFDEDHIAFDKEVIEALHGDASDPYYSGEGGEQGGTEPEPTPEPGDDNNSIDVDNINSNTQVNSSTPDGDSQSNPLGDENPNLLGSNSNTDDTAGNDENDEAIGTKDNEAIILNNDPSSVEPVEP